MKEPRFMILIYIHTTAQLAASTSFPSFDQTTVVKLIVPR